MERKTKNRKEKGEGCWCIYLGGSKILHFILGIVDEQESFERIRNESIETLTTAIELMYPFAEDKLHFLSEMIASLTNQRREKMLLIILQ